MIDRRRDRQLVRRGEQQLPADAEIVEIVHLVARDGVEDCAISFGARERQPPGELLTAQRTGDRGLRLNESETAVIELHLGGRREVRFARRHVDGAGGGVLAEQRPLRAAQHLDPLDVEEVERRGSRARVEDAVDVKADARFDPVVGQPERRAESANVDRRVPRVGRVELHRRDQLLQPVHVERAGVRDQVAAHDGHRNWHLLRDLLDAAGGDDDVLAET